MTWTPESQTKNPTLNPGTMESYAASHQGGAPLVFYNASTSKSSPLPPMTVFSPLSTPKVARDGGQEGRKNIASLKLTAKAPENR